jgi:hypothetical protein
MGCGSDAGTLLEPDPGSVAAAGHLTTIPAAPASAEILVTGLQGASGSTVGPDGALYVTEGATGTISRVDPLTGDVTPFATGLPPAIIEIGGAVDLVFLDGTAYVLVTIVSDPLFPTGEINGIYRVDGLDSFTVIADLGAFNLANQPTGFEYALKTGVLYAIEAYQGGFLVTDGHLNRIIHASLDGTATEFAGFGNIVPTGMHVRGSTVLMAEAGPVPHLPEDGRVLQFGPGPRGPVEIASGAPLLVDVERGRGQTLFALSQGIFGGGDPGAPALPNTGSLVSLGSGGEFTTVIEGLDRPTSLEIIRNSAYVVTLPGEIVKIDGIAAPPFGVR